MTIYPNQEGLNRALNIYRTYMRSFIVFHLKKIQGQNVEDVVIDSVGDKRAEEICNKLIVSDLDIKSIIDIDDFPLLVRANWKFTFKIPLNDNRNFQNQLWLIKTCRDQSWAHPPEGDAEPEGTRAHLFLIADVLDKINTDARDEIKKIRNQLFADEVEEHPAEAENADLKKRLEVISDKLEAEKEKNAKSEKYFQDVQDQLKTAKVKQIANEKNLKATVNQLKALESENIQLKKRIVEAGRQQTTGPMQQPDNFTKLQTKTQVSKPPRGETETQRRYRNFFQRLVDELREVHQFTRAKATTRSNWYSFSSGHRGFTYCVKFRRGPQVTVYVMIDESDNPDTLALFDSLKNKKDAITETFGGTFEWQRNAEKKRSRILFVRDRYVDWDTGDMDVIHKWCVKHLLKLKEVFDPKIRQALREVEDR